MVSFHPLDPTDLVEQPLLTGEETGATRQLVSLDFLPAAMRKALEAPVPLPPRERRELVRIVGLQLSEKSCRPRREQIRSAAAQVVAAYPLSLEDRGINGQLLGRGYDSFFQQLENRIENMSRGKRQSSRKGWRPVSPLIFQMMEEAPKKDTMELLVRVRDQAQREDAVQVPVLPFLCAHFKEDIKCLYRVFEEGTSITEKLPELPSTPTIIVLGNIFEGQCFVATEQQLLFSESSDFVEATCLVFLCYYVLNMAYASGASTSLEFLQRQIFDINPSKGSRSEGGQKSRTNVHSKIMKLAQKLRFSQ
ncbi:hypothetical protein MTO96_015927 [Rhipicephalus appendiculatus]